MFNKLRRNMCRRLGSLTRPSQILENNNMQTTTKIGRHFPAPITKFRPKLCVSRHVTFTPSTLDHLEYRRLVVRAMPSAFQNFVREMLTGYYGLKLMEERRKYGLAPDYPLSGRRLPIKDLVQLQIVAKDMWRKMSPESKQRYKQLAKEAALRKKQRLPPDPYRVQVSTTKKSDMTFQHLKTQMEC
ncbi:uncharacterized protein LOC110179411 [Drosophila serrata]|uniref:uncharacterized protein LOC110179411 n=1 Tax=Drosophila serrata TaxID=7274 RepID=UPI000A1CF56D|nr:uncharacterized protein LOC110179411 [Drosophila serrata]